RVRARVRGEARRSGGEARRSGARGGEVALQPEPARAPIGPEALLALHLLNRRRVERARFLGPGEEVDVDAANAAFAELDVTRAAPEVAFGRIAAADLRDDALRDDARGTLGEHARLGYACGGDVADRVHPVVARGERREVDGDVPLLGQAARDDDL